MLDSELVRDDAREFVASNHRAVLVTRRSGGGTAELARPGWGRPRGEAGHLHQGGAYKTRNLRCDPTAVLCVFSDRFFGRWMQIEGRAQIVSLPEAMDGLIDYYRRISKEHPDWDDYRRAMEQHRRVLVRVSIDTVDPTRTS